MTRLALSALLATLALLGPAPAALAHTELIASDPANGASLPQAPTRLTLTFSQPVPAESATVTVTAPDGTAWKVGEITAQGATLTAPVVPNASPAGAYTVGWEVVALDGDFVNGKTTFTLAAPPAAVTPSPAPGQSKVPVTTEPVATTGSSAAPTTTAATTTSAQEAAATPEEGGGVPLWAWIVGAVLLVAVAVAVALRVRKGREPAEQSPTE